MQRLQFSLFQMDEAKRHLMTGQLPALRLALILLDNAADILLDVIPGRRASAYVVVDW